jgi:hypothetical protein
MNTADAIRNLLAIPNTPVDGWRWETRKIDRAGTIMLKPDAGAPAEHVAAYKAFKGYEYHEPPAPDVCDAAGVELDAGIVACVLSSEINIRKPAYLLACAHALINDATALFPSKEAGKRRADDGILLRVTGGPARRRFGRQAGAGMARYCASSQPPTQRTLAAARLALAGVGADLAQGARRWLDPQVQDGGWQAGEQLANDAEAIFRSRYRDGWELVRPDPRIDQDELALLARDGVSLAEALAVLAAGRARRPRG